MTITYEGKVPEKCEASSKFKCKNVNKSLEELGVFYVSTFPKYKKNISERKFVCLCKKCHFKHGSGKQDKDLGERFELQENGAWLLIERQYSRKLKNDEKIVNKKLIKKVERIKKVKRIVNRIPLAKSVIACYYCAIDPATPLHVKLSMFASLAYFINQFDAIPDFLLGPGYIDDAAVNGSVMGIFAAYVTEGHQKAAMHLLEGKVDGCDCPYCIKS